MKREKSAEENRHATRKVAYSAQIVVALVLIAAICGIAWLVWGVWKGMDGTSTLFSLQAIVTGIVCIFFLIVLVCRLIKSAPETVSEIEYERKRQNVRDELFLGDYFVLDTELREAMTHILHLIENKLYSEADEKCIKLLEDCYIPEEQAAILYCREICREEMGYTKEAISYGEKAVSLRKGYFPALMETASLYMKINKLAAAEQFLSEAQNSSPRDIRPLFMLHQVYTAQNRHREALDAVMRCEEMAPNSVDIAACVCRAALKCGETDIVNSRMRKCADARYKDYAALRKEVRGY